MSDRGIDQSTGGASGPLDRDTFSHRVEALLDRLYGTALRLARDPDDAEDIVAEAIALAWQRRADLRDPERFDGWLFRILDNAFLDSLRRRRCRQDREVATDFATEESGGDSEFSLFARLHQPFLLWWGTPEEEFIGRLMLEDIQQALDELPDAFRIVVILVEIQGHTYDEAAEILTVPVGTIRSRLSRGRSLLQKALWVQACEAGIVPAADGTDPDREEGPE